VDLLYRHFAFPHTAAGAFEYWVVMQELWSSARWTHSRVIASADELMRITAAGDWQMIQPVEQHEPAVVRIGTTFRLAVLVFCPLQRFQIQLQQVEIDASQALHYLDPILVAAGPRGYLS